MITLQLPKGRVLFFSLVFPLWQKLKSRVFFPKIPFLVRMSLENILYELVFLIIKNYYSISYKRKSKTKDTQITKKARQKIPKLLKSTPQKILKLLNVTIKNTFSFWLLFFIAYICGITSKRQSWQKKKTTHRSFLLQKRKSCLYSPIT